MPTRRRPPATISFRDFSATARAGSTRSRASRDCIRISADGKTVDVLATGFRNADGLGLTSGGVITVPNSEGDSVPASMVCEVKPGGHYGYPGPRNGRPPDLPLVYLPRGLDNSSGAQVEINERPLGASEGPDASLFVRRGDVFLAASRQRRTASRKGPSCPWRATFCRAFIEAGSAPRMASST